MKESLLLLNCLSSIYELSIHMELFFTWKTIQIDLLLFEIKFVNFKNNNGLSTNYLMSNRDDFYGHVRHHVRHHVQHHVGSWTIQIHVICSLLTFVQDRQKS